MPSIVAYQKHITREITVELEFPVDANNQHQGAELATVDGFTYVSLPDGATLPAQRAEIDASVQYPVTLTVEQRDAIRQASPHVRLINQRVRDAIAERYSQSEEIKLLRTAPSDEFTAYNAYVEDCRAWGRAEKAKLGL